MAKQLVVEVQPGKVEYIYIAASLNATLEVDTCGTFNLVISSYIQVKNRAGDMAKSVIMKCFF